jgi:hypothetical protein
MVMRRFIRRLIGVLVLDSGAFEEIEADRHASMQSVIVVLAVCAAAGFAAFGLQVLGAAGFAAVAIGSLGAWLVWAAVVTTIGTLTLPEQQTRSDLPELLRVLGFAWAPGVFIGLASMRAAAPLVTVMVVAWTIAATVIGVRQALDYRSMPRAIAVCVVSWIVTFGVMFAGLMMFGRQVS